MRLPFQFLHHLSYRTTTTRKRTCRTQEEVGDGHPTRNASLYSIGSCIFQHVTYSFTNWNRVKSLLFPHFHAQRVYILFEPLIVTYCIRLNSSAERWLTFTWQWIKTSTYKQTFYISSFTFFIATILRRRSRSIASNFTLIRAEQCTTRWKCSTFT